jgi:hypothetical protein
LKKGLAKRKRMPNFGSPNQGERKEQQALENIERPGTKGRVGVVNTSALLRRKRKNECFLYFKKLKKYSSSLLQTKKNFLPLHSRNERESLSLFKRETNNTSQQQVVTLKPGEASFLSV